MTKIAWWDSCSFHGDIDTGYGSWNDGQKQQPAYDMICAGRLISEWILQYGSEDKELKRLVEVLVCYVRDPTRFSLTLLTKDQPRAINATVSEQCNQSTADRSVRHS